MECNNEGGSVSSLDISDGIHSTHWRWFTVTDAFKRTTRILAFEGIAVDSFSPEFGMRSVERSMSFASEEPAYVGREETRRHSQAAQTQRQAERHASAVFGSYFDALAYVPQSLIEHKTVNGNSVYDLLLESGQVVSPRNGSAPALQRRMVAAFVSKSRHQSVRYRASELVPPRPYEGPQGYAPTTTRLTRPHVFRVVRRDSFLQGAKDLAILFCQRRYRVLIRPTVKVLARIHLGLLRASRGKLGRRLFGGRVVLLTTVGRRSGRKWTTPLAYMRHGDSLVVAASCGGSDRLPDWWLNLQRRPVAVIEVSGRKSVVRAYEAEHQTLVNLTAEFEENFPQMNFYRRVSSREIPLIVLKPTRRADVGWRAVRTAL